MSQAFREALARHQGTRPVEQLLRSSLIAAEMHYERRQRSRLIVETPGSALSPRESAEIMNAIVDATAMFSRYRRNPRKSVVQIRADYRDAINLKALVSGSNAMVFEIPPAPTIQGPELFAGEDMRSLTGYAVQDMCQVLPEGPEDDLALDAVLSLPITQRVAIQQLVKAVAKTQRSLGISIVDDTYGADASEMHSVLLRDQAEVLQANLLESIRKTVRIPPMVGILDGMRTHRRIFFLERDGEPDLFGSVAEEILSQLPSLIGKLVSVDLEKSVMVQRSGRSHRPTFRLLGIREAGNLLEE
ncbi:hypothetical protein [Nocardia salmonicida]|uniref:hypothetical protein n=1 Tax=Nocardia salmonicida TaxID=53431 RepID=UPI0034053D18